ncbi:MAG: hypothetical protein ACFB15_09505 [Cyclobacteriaceae bacterium]
MKASTQKHTSTHRLIALSGKTLEERNPTNSDKIFYVTANSSDPQLSDHLVE